MELINPLTEAYASRYSSSCDALLEEIAARTESTQSQAHMMSSRLQGKFLEIFSMLLRPSKLLAYREHFLCHFVENCS